MQPSSLASAGCRIRKRRPVEERTTAWYIFDKENTYLYEINRANFQAANHMFGMPTVTDGTRADEERISREMVPTSGTIMEMVDRFIEGAQIAIPAQGVAAEIYKRILNHFDHHFVLMKTDRMYEAPNPEDFTHMAEFATQIREWALSQNPDIEKQEQSQSLMRQMPVRASFSQAPVVEKTREVPKITKAMDNIQRWMESQHGG